MATRLTRRQSLGPRLARNLERHADEVAVKPRRALEVADGHFRMQVLHGSALRRRISSNTLSGIERKVSTTAGSKWVPAQRRISLRAASNGIATEYGRSKVI